MHVTAEAKGAPQTTTPAQNLRSAGGPDTFGYVFRDSREPDGPAFEWVEIAPPAGGDGSILAPLTGMDDAYFFPLDLPFPFNFYGAEYTQLAVASNGTLYFEDQYLGFGNSQIPGVTGYGVQRFIAHLWDDLMIRPGAVYYQDLGNMLVIEFYQVSNCCTSPDSATWEVILFENGSILVQYQDVDVGDGSSNGSSATVGIQGDPQTGLQYSYGMPALASNLAICFAYPGTSPDCKLNVPWLELAPMEGAISAGGQIGIAVNFDASVPEVDQPGDYLAKVLVRTVGWKSPAPVDVTMRVLPPATWGKIQGVVRSRGFCDANPAPLKAAQITVRGAGGFERLLESDQDGVYELWMSAADGPFTITAVMADYIAQEAANVVVVAGAATTHDFDLRWLEPCVNTATRALEVTMDLNATHSETILLANAGAIPGQFKIHEYESETPPAADGTLANTSRFDSPAVPVAASKLQQENAAGLAIPVPAPGNVPEPGTIIQSWPAVANPNAWGVAYTTEGEVWVSEGWGEQHMDEYRANGTAVGHSHPYPWNPQPTAQRILPLMPIPGSCGLQASARARTASMKSTQKSASPATPSARRGMYWRAGWPMTQAQTHFSAVAGMT